MNQSAGRTGGYSLCTTEPEPGRSLFLTLAKWKGSCAGCCWNLQIFTARIITFVVGSHFSTIPKRSPAELQNRHELCLKPWVDMSPTPLNLGNLDLKNGTCLNLIIGPFPPVNIIDAHDKYIPGTPNNQFKIDFW